MEQKPPEMSKGLRMALQLVGITPEMLHNPAVLLKQFGLNPDDIIKKVAEIQQIGLRIEAAFIDNSVRLARIERQLGIDSGADDGAGAELGKLDARPRDRRN